MSRCAALSLGRGMASTVVAQRHLWLTMSDMSERDRVSYLDEPVSSAGLFGHSLEAIQAKFEARKKQTEALRSILPRREAKQKPAWVARKPATPFLAVKRSAPAVLLGNPPLKQQPQKQAPRHSAWSRGPPPGPLKDSAAPQEAPPFSRTGAQSKKDTFYPSIVHKAPVLPRHVCTNIPSILSQFSGAVITADSQLMQVISPFISPWVERTVCVGYRLQFRIPPPRFSSVVFTRVSGSAAAVLKEEIRNLLSKEAIRVVPQTESRKGWYSRYFVVPKKDGGARPILDLRVLNKHLRVFTFKMLTLRQFLRSIGPGDWFTSIDLTNAYFHIAIHPDHRKYLRFAFEGVAYEWLVLPFGLSLAPRTFTKCMEAALAPLRGRGVRVLAYLDDLAIIARSKVKARTDTNAALSHLKRLGLSVNLKKSSLIPSQKLSFLGLEICSLSSRACLSERRICALRDGLAQFQLGRKLRVRQFLQLLGQMASAIAVVPLGLLLMRAFQRWLLFHRLIASRQLGKRIVVTRACMTALSPWRESRLLCQGSPIGRVLFRKVVSTDASLTGWGAVFDQLAVKGAWSLAQRSHHINCLELLAVHLALKHFLPVLCGQHVLVRTDNTTVVSYINRQGGTRSLPLLKLSQTLLLWSSLHLLSLRATHIPGHLNLGADLLSRGGPSAREWRISPLVAMQIWDRFGRANVDLFASRENAHCPLFFSLTDHSAPLGVDALAHPWPNTLLYAFPPVALILPTLERVCQGNLSLILVAPCWPSKPWYAEIISLLAGDPWPLPFHKNLLSQAGGEIVHPRPELWCLHAYPLKVGEEEECTEQYFPGTSGASMPLNLSHFSTKQQKELRKVIPPKLFNLKEEVKMMLNLGVIEPSTSSGPRGMAANFLSLFVLAEGPTEKLSREEEGCSITDVGKLVDLYAGEDGTDSTWLSDSIPDAAIQLDGLATFRADRDPALCADVRKTLCRVDPRKAAGPDNIPDRVVRECADQLADVFTDIFNISLSSAVVPTCFKNSTIIPVPKNSFMSCLNDYRPVALTPVITKCSTVRASS
ncbi:uncharacterized protein [Hoplias malabaricus]|uniref:uncharacterized protein n=1 Tax=Hoplias malabaricus TaxID=27720 RepID=UPI003462F060